MAESTLYCKVNKKKQFSNDFSYEKMRMVLQIQVKKLLEKNNISIKICPPFNKAQEKELERFNYDYFPLVRYTKLALIS